MYEKKQPIRHYVKSVTSPLCTAGNLMKRQINVREHRRGNQNGQSRETGNIGYTRRRKTNKKHNTICVGRHYTKTKTNYVNKT